MSAKPCDRCTMIMVNYADLWLILDTVVVFHSVEGVVCEEQEGCANVYNALYCVLQGSRVSPPWFSHKETL
jgi:hypothetical protein